MNLKKKTSHFNGTNKLFRQLSVWNSTTGPLPKTRRKKPKRKQKIDWLSIKHVWSTFWQVEQWLMQHLVYSKSVFFFFWFCWFAWTDWLVLKSEWSKKKFNKTMQKSNFNLYTINSFIIFWTANTRPYRYPTQSHSWAVLEASSYLLCSWTAVKVLTTWLPLRFHVWHLLVALKIFHIHLHDAHFHFFF